MKKNTSYLLILIITLSFFSCSVTFEKRRYRPGYHVDVVKHNFRSTNQSIHFFETRVEKNNLLTPPMPTHKGSQLRMDLTIDSLNGPNKKDHLSGPCYHQIIKRKKYEDHHNFLRKPIPKNLAGKKTRIAIGWGLGGTAIVAGTAGILMSVFGSLTLLAAGLGVLAFAFILGVLAFIFGFKKSKEEKAEDADKYKPVSQGFINTGFIISIVAMGLALVGFVLGFFIYPFGLIGWIISIVAVLASILSFSLGFRALKDDRGIKTKLIIIFGFIALLIAALGLMMLFI